MDLLNFFKNRKGSEWAPLYLIIVVIIGVVLLVTLVKPALRQASQSAVSSGEEARAYAAIGSILLGKLKRE